MNRLILLILLSNFLLAGFAQNPAVKPCSSIECSQFDFWLGDWNLTWGDSAKGTNTIRKILDGCVVNENFMDPAGKYSGMSWSLYDPVLKEWKQTWVDNQGGYILLNGKYSDGEMALYTATVADSKSAPVIYRMVFYHIQTGSFDWKWESSADSKKTWKLNWQIHYQRKN